MAIISAIGIGAGGTALPFRPEIVLKPPLVVFLAGPGFEEPGAFAEYLARKRVFLVWVGMVIDER